VKGRNLEAHQLHYPRCERDDLRDGQKKSVDGEAIGYVLRSGLDSMLAIWQASRYLPFGSASLDSLVVAHCFYRILSH